MVSGVFWCFWGDLVVARVFWGVSSEIWVVGRMFSWFLGCSGVYVVIWIVDRVFFGWFLG